jgi:hypothetical protein
MIRVRRARLSGLESMRRIQSLLEVFGGDGWCLVLIADNLA